MHMQAQIWDFAHEAGHLVAAELRGAVPRKVRFEKQRLVVEAAPSAEKDAIVLAAGYAAEWLLFGTHRRGQSDEARIAALGEDFETAVRQARNFLAPYREILWEVTATLHNAAVRGKKEVPFGELAPLLKNL